MVSLNSFPTAHSLLLSCMDNDPKITLRQTLLVQDGKLYGEYLFSDVISRALSLPDIIGDKEFQMNEFVVQLGQVRHQDHSCFTFVGGYLSFCCNYRELSLINLYDNIAVGYQLAENSLYKHCMATAQAWEEFAGLEYYFHTGVLNQCCFSSFFTFH